MTPDVLFWFYKDFETCESRLRALRRLSPTVRVFGLYAGPPEDADAARSQLGQYLDDFYSFDQARDARWKWKNGDLVIAAWFRERGFQLDWETIFVFQWDMLLLERVENLFPTLKPGEMLVSGYRPLKEIENWWPWSNPANPLKRRDLETFKSLLESQYGYRGEMFACLFIVVCLPRLFLERYVAAGPPEAGFLEYKVPTMGAVFGIPVRPDSRYEPWWAANPSTKTAPASRRTLNAVGNDVSLSVILEQVSAHDGKRLFHPVRRAIADWKLKSWNARWLRYFYSGTESISKVRQRLRRGERVIVVTMSGIDRSS